MGLSNLFLTDFVHSTGVPPSSFLQGPGEKVLMLLLNLG